MSLVGKRALFKAALDTVPDVRGFESKPSTPKSGDAWPLLGSGELDEAAGLFAWSWSIGVFLPADRAAADAWIDEHLLDLTQAIWTSGIGLVTEASPANFGTETNYVYGLLLTVRSD